MHTFPVETTRLRMRPLSAEDEALFVQLYTDDESMRFIGAPLSAERATRSFRAALRGMRGNPIERLFLTVIEKDTAATVGVYSLQDYDEQRRSVQAGVMILAAARAKGYSKEGLIGLIPRVFAELAVDELWVQIAADHAAGHRSATSVGFVRRHEPAPDGQPGQLSVWSVRRHTWRAPHTT